MQRRAFLKGACRICLLGAAASSVAGGLNSCSPAISKGIYKTTIKDKQVSVPLSFFTANRMVIVSPSGYPYEISVEKRGTEFFALLLRCTHYENQLTPTGNGYSCPAHGSKFDKDGNVVTGPAETALLRLHTTLSDDALLVHL